MKYPYIVVKNGVWYPAGAEVPAGAPMKANPADEVPADALESVKPKRGRKPKEA